MNILIIEDDYSLLKHLEETFLRLNYTVRIATSKEALMKQLDQSSLFDVIVLDRLLDGFDTRQIFSNIKKKWVDSSIIVLSAISTPIERTDMINLGADDYLGKPFTTDELLARVGSLWRKKVKIKESVIQLGNMKIDLEKRIVLVNHVMLELAPKEFMLLNTLANVPTQIWSREALLETIWGITKKVETNVVQSTMLNLRKKMEEAGSVPKIKNLRNSGYWLAV